MRTLFALPIAAAIVAVFALPAEAQEPALSVPIDTVTYGAPNTIHVLGERPSGALEGQTCDVMVEGANNSSVHPGNDLIVQSNGDAIVLEDIERAAGAVTTASSRLTVGPTLTLSVRLGEDIRPNGLVVSSGGGIVSLLNCTSPPPPPTVPPAEPPATPPTVEIGEPVPPLEKPPATSLPHTGAETPILAAAGLGAIGAGAALLRKHGGRRASA
jgi:LPXTG-motif cell wall-anchored protein